MAAAAYDNVLDLIGNTPLVRINTLDTGPCELFVKLESQNPGGSIKDRIGKSMIEAAERDGRLQPGGTIIEATAGNTGLGLALVAAQKGYRLILVIPDKMSLDKVTHLKALGAEVIMTRSDVCKGHPSYYQDIAERLSKEIPGAFWVDQFANPANPLAHETTTAPEIWAQMSHDLDYVVCGVGSGGTIAGLSRYFARHAPGVRILLADPDGSVVGETARTGKTPQSAGTWLVEGIGEDFIPPNCDLSLVADVISVSDREAFHAARELLLREGILGGSSTGTLLAASLRFCRAQKRRKRVVTFVCDTGNKYLSKVYNDAWLIDNGLLVREKHGDLRDLITHRADRNEVVQVAPGDTLLTVYGRMRMYDVSQLPVMEHGEIIGLIDELDLLKAVHGNPERFMAPVSGVMVTDLIVLPPQAGLDELLPIFAEEKVTLIVDDGIFYGLITRIDFINHLRRQR